MEYAIFLESGSGILQANGSLNRALTSINPACTGVQNDTIILRDPHAEHLRRVLTLASGKASPS